MITVSFRCPSGTLRLPALILVLLMTILAGCGDEPQPDRVTIPAPLSPLAAVPAEPPSSSAPPVLPAPPAAVVDPGEALPGAAAPWAVEVAAYHVRANADEAVNRLTAMGYSPLLVSASRPTAMSRLLVSVSPGNSWRAQLASMRRLEPGAFAVRSGGRVRIYAGTYRLASTIDEVTARLAAEGIAVKREGITVSLPVTVVRIGGFADRDSAVAAADRLRGLGYGGAACVDMDE